MFYYLPFSFFISVTCATSERISNENIPRKFKILFWSVITIYTQTSSFFPSLAFSFLRLYESRKTNDDWRNGTKANSKSYSITTVCTTNTNSIIRTFLPLEGGRLQRTKNHFILKPHPQKTIETKTSRANISLHLSLSLKHQLFNPRPPIDYTRKLNSLLAKSILELAKRPPSRKKSNDPPVSEPSKLYFTNRGESATFRRCMHKRSIIIHIAFSPVSTLAFIRLAFLLPLGEAKGRRSEGWRGENKWKEGSGSCAKTMAFVSTLVIHENNRASSRFLNIFSLSVCLSLALLLFFTSNPLQPPRRLTVFPRPFVVFRSGFMRLLFLPRGRI